MLTHIFLKLMKSFLMNTKKGPMNEIKKLIGPIFFLINDDNAIQYIHHHHHLIRKMS